MAKIKNNVENGESATSVAEVMYKAMETMNCEEEAAAGQPESIYQVNNHIYFYKEITAESAALFNKLLTEMYYDLVGSMLSTGLTNPIVEIHINSPGGTLAGGLSMVRKINEIKKGFGTVKVPIKVNSHIEGESCSAATLVYCVGSYRTMPEYSYMLIHDVISGVAGPRGEIVDHVKNLELFNKIIKEIYKANSKLTDEILDDVMKNDLYFDAATCLKYGLVDEII